MIRWDEEITRWNQRHPEKTPWDTSTPHLFLRALYLETKNIVTLAERLRMGHNTVSKYMRHFGIPSQSRRQAATRDTPAKAKIREALVLYPEASVGSIARRTGYAPSLVAYHKNRMMKELAERELENANPPQS